MREPPPGSEQKTNTNAGSSGVGDFWRWLLLLTIFTAVALLVIGTLLSNPDGGVRAGISRTHVAQLEETRAASLTDAAVPTTEPTSTSTSTPVPTRTPTATMTPTATPTPTSTATLTPMVITPLPQPADLFAAATHVAEQTRQVERHGTATPLPPNVVTATFTPKPLVVTNTPTPGNQETATYQAVVATALAATTGTPTLPAVPVVTATPSPTRTPKPIVTPKPTSTPTPLFQLLSDITPTPIPQFPSELVGKILFKGTALGEPKNPHGYYMINPDGTGLARLTGSWLFRAAEGRDSHSTGGEVGAVARVDPRTRRWQIFLRDYGSNELEQVTYFSFNGLRTPVLSPEGDAIAYVTWHTGNDEIWVIERGEKTGTQLTFDKDVYERHPSWAPGGNQIVYYLERDGKTRIWIMDADGRNKHPITSPDYDAWDPVWVKYADS
ncbi:MAG: hypothetical protein U9R25_09445 [Chloroflexota bacterium]|nr:hypothetical protein [Chloroflexota bacterium]